jgi:hypothetical protein
MEVSTYKSSRPLLVHRVVYVASLGRHVLDSSILPTFRAENCERLQGNVKVPGKPQNNTPPRTFSPVPAFQHQIAASLAQNTRRFISATRHQPHPAITAHMSHTSTMPSSSTCRESYRLCPKHMQNRLKLLECKESRITQSEMECLAYVILQMGTDCDVDGPAYETRTSTRRITVNYKRLRAFIVYSQSRNHP